MIGDRPSARAWAGSTARTVLPPRVGGEYSGSSSGASGSPGTGTGAGTGAAAACGGR